MQFTVLIEFLVPGLATTLLALALLPESAIPQAPQNMPSGETATALLLLAVSYPVGILVNFLIYALQRKLVTPRLHRVIIEKYRRMGVDLPELAGQQLRFGKAIGATNTEELRELFNLLRAFVASGNIDRMNSIISFQEGLQRFARGMLLPLILASILVWRARTPSWGTLVIIFTILFMASWALLRYSLTNEEEHVARFFISQILHKEGRRDLTSPSG